VADTIFDNLLVNATYGSSILHCGMIQTVMNQNDQMLTLIRRGIILFWAVWYSLVFSSDAINLLQHLHVIPTSWTFSSNNYDLVAGHIATYGIHSTTVALLLFGIIVVWVLTNAMLFWRAVFTFNEENAHKAVYLAFIASMGLYATFILSDEIFIKYQIEHWHDVQFGFLLITFFVFLKLTEQRN